MKTIIMLTLAIIIAPVATQADDWPAWGGSPGRNMVNTVEKNLPAEWDTKTGKNVKWSAQLGSQSYGNPVVSGGKVFVGTNNEAGRQPESLGDKGVIMCFAEKDGTFLWQATHDKLLAGRVNDWPQQGICSSPAVEGNRLYYVSNRCELVCADTEGFLDGENDGPFREEKLTGKIDADIVWSLDMMAELDVFPHNLATSSPIIVGDLIFLVTGNGVDEGHIVLPSPASPSFIAVDKNTGEVVWEDASPGEDILHGQWSGPACGVVDGVAQAIFPGGDGFIYSFEQKSGELLWKFNCNPEDSYWELGGEGTKNNIIATPVLYDGKVYISVGQDPEHGEGEGHLWCIDASKRGDITETAAIWHNGSLNRSMSTIAIHDGVIYHCDLSGVFQTFDLKTGKALWQHDMLAAVWGSPYVADGKVYIGNEDGDLLVFAVGREKRVIATCDLRNSVYTTPVAANGVLYVTNRQRLFALKTGAQSNPEDIR